MFRILPGIVLLVLCAVASADEKDRPRKDPRPTEEKIDSSVDRSLTGFVKEAIGKKDEAAGHFFLSTGKGQPLYRFEVDGKTKFLTNGGAPLEGGLASLPTGAEVRVVFVDKQPKAEKLDQADRHQCRAVQIINAGK